VAGDAVGPLLLLFLLAQVSEVVALPKALVDVAVTSPTRGGDVLEADGTPHGQASGDFGPVRPLLVANFGIPTVAILATHVFLMVNGYIPFLKIVVELLGGDEEVWIAVAFDAEVRRVGYRRLSSCRCLTFCCGVLPFGCRYLPSGKEK